MKNLLLIFLFASSIFSYAGNKARFASMFTDNMVIQQKSDIKVWGYANPKEALKLSVSWLKKASVFNADETGKWQTTIKTPKAGFEAQHIILTGANGFESRLNNILVGEVWLCSGQSNMEMIMQNQPEWNLLVENSAHEISNANFPDIRFLTVNRKESFQPVEEISTSGWKICNPENARWMSAAAYFFGKKIFEQLRVPVGLVVSAYGGSPVQSWIPSYIMDTASMYDPEKKERETQLLASLQTPEAYLQAMTEWIRESEKNSRAAVSQSITIDLPVNLEKSKVGIQSGELLFSKIIQVPENQRGKDLHINLGTIDDMGTILFNGEIVWQEIRNSKSYSSARFTVPASKVKPGGNLVEVKVLNVLWGGGMTGPAGSMYFTLGSDTAKYPLAGKWDYQKIFDLSATTPIPNEGKPLFSTAGALYNGMINPMLNFTFKGCLWYQGESNVGDEERYPRMLSDMIESWRKLFRNDFPFYYVQIAPYNYGGVQRDKAARLRYAQARIAETVPHTGMVVTIDIGDASNIHPARKKEVGQRLALLALSETYHRKIACKYPSVTQVERKSDNLIIHVTDVYQHLTSTGECTEFEISADDLTYFPAKAVIASDRISVSNPNVPNPRYVRYCWKDTSKGNVFNSENLPLSTFKKEVKIPGSE